MTVFTARGELHPVPPFDLRMTLKVLKATPALRDTGSTEGGFLHMAVCAGGQPVVFHLADLGTVERPKLEYTLYSAHGIGEYARMAAASRIAFFLSLDDDLGFFYELGREDAHFSRVIDRLYGYHQAKTPTPFESACWAVFVQRTHSADAARMRTAIVDTLGGHVTLHGHDYSAFPTPERVLQAKHKTLAALLGSESRAGHLLAAAAAFRDADHLFLREGPYAEVFRWLCSLEGIGEWSAAQIMIRGLGRTERLPEGDPDIAQAVTDFYELTRPATPEQVERLARRYGHWQGYWAHYVRTAQLCQMDEAARARERAAALREKVGR